MHEGYVYTADRTRGVDVLRLTSGAATARASGRAVTAPPASKRQRRFLARMATRYKPDPGTARICFLQTA
jgi:hypothetical protein